MASQTEFLAQYQAKRFRAQITLYAICLGTLAAFSLYCYEGSDLATRLLVVFLTTIIGCITVGFFVRDAIVFAATLCKKP